MQSDSDLDRLRKEIAEVAAKLLSQGKRPTLLLVENEVKVERRTLMRLLEEWARGISSESGRDENGDSAFDRSRPRDAKDARSAFVPVAAVAAAREAADKKARKRDVIAIQDLNAEIVQTRAVVVRLMERKENGDDSENLSTNLRKVITRLKKMEERLSDLERENPAAISPDTT